MLFCYNLFQIIIAPIAAPILLCIALFRGKYRKRTPARLGYRLRQTIPQHLPTPVFWIHALSVGETTSALPLIDGLKSTYPNCTIVFSVTTKSGRKTADTTLHERVDYIIDSPFDLLPVVRHFIKIISPDCFILIETDFWPNLLSSLKKDDVPIALVNGRVSDKAMKGYKKMPFFLRKIFLNFDLLCCQTEADRKKIHALGVPLNRLHTLGNLKFDTTINLNETRHKKREEIIQSISAQIPSERIYFIAGSTHKGEEKIILKTFERLYREFPQLYLIIAPRNISRCTEILNLCNDPDSVIRRSSKKITKEKREKSTILILDTIGELATCYTLGTFSFVGGSLVLEGGHNPIEPAVTGQPVIFGQSMEDFNEIASTLLEAGGAFMVKNPTELEMTIRRFIIDLGYCKRSGEIAKSCILAQQGVIKQHIAKIEEISTLKKRDIFLIATDL